MGISKAKGMALANRLAGRPRRIFVLTGDGELQEGQLWESLASAANRGLGEIVAVVDHNKIQSDTWVSRVSDLGDVEAKFRAFGWHVSRCDGHDVAAIERVMRSLDAVTDRPKVVIADTVKGRGVDFMEGPALKEGELYGYHSGAPSEVSYQAGLTQLLSHANAALADLTLGPVRTETTVRNPRREPRQTDNLVAAYERALVAQGEARPDPARAGRRPDQGLRPGVVCQAVPRALHRMRHRRAGHGVDGRRHGAPRRAAGRALVRLFPGGAPQRADLQPVQRALEGGLRGVAGRAAPGRPGALTPVGARHLGAGRRAPLADGGTNRGGGSGAAL